MKNFNEEYQVVQALKTVKAIYKDKRVDTFSLNIHAMATDCLDALERTLKTLETIEKICEESHIINFKDDGMENLKYAFERIEMLLNPYEPIDLESELEVK